MTTLYPTPMVTPTSSVLGKRGAPFTLSEPASKIQATERAKGILRTYFDTTPIDQIRLADWKPTFPNAREELIELFKKNAPFTKDIGKQFSLNQKNYCVLKKTARAQIDPTTLADSINWPEHFEEVFAHRKEVGVSPWLAQKLPLSPSTISNFIAILKLLKERDPTQPLSPANYLPLYKKPLYNEKKPIEFLEKQPLPALGSDPIIPPELKDALPLPVMELDQYEFPSSLLSILPSGNSSELARLVNDEKTDTLKDSGFHKNHIVELRKMCRLNREPSAIWDILYFILNPDERLRYIQLLDDNILYPGDIAKQIPSRPAPLVGKDRIYIDLLKQIKRKNTGQIRLFPNPIPAAQSALADLPLAGPAASALANDASPTPAVEQPSQGAPPVVEAQPMDYTIPDFPEPYSPYTQRYIPSPPPSDFLDFRAE